MVSLQILEPVVREMAGYRARFCHAVHCLQDTDGGITIKGYAGLGPGIKRATVRIDAQKIYALQWDRSQLNAFCDALDRLDMLMFDECFEPVALGAPLG